MISVASVVNALFFYTIILIIVCLLRVFIYQLLKFGGAFILLTASGYGTLRLVLPLEIPINHLIRSWNLLGTPVRILRTYPELTEFLVRVWVIGAILFLAWDAFTLYRAYRMSAKYVLVDDEYVQKIAEECSISYPVVVSPNVEVPYVEGIFRHTIYLPILDLPDPEEEIRYILLHEAQHIRNYDSVIKFFFRILLAVMWWNPFAHLFWLILGDLLEFRCDAGVTRFMSAQERIDYGNALKDMAASLVKKKKPLSPVVVSEFIGFGKNKFIKQRMDIILNGTSMPTRRARIAAQFVLVVLFCASYLVVFQPAGTPSESVLPSGEGISYDESIDGLDIHSDRRGDFIIRETDGRYRLCINYEFSRYLTEDEVASDQYKDLFIFEESK